MYIFIPALYLIVISISAYLGIVSIQLMFLYLIMSSTTFAIYAMDKAAARNRSRRTPEATLHILAVIGGWPGAMLAQQIFRHKTIKRPFRWAFWLTVGVNVAVVWALPKQHALQF